jgi:hypothetical protein
MESSAKNQPLFEKILAVNLSDSDLDDLAKKLEGYNVAMENPPKSTGRVEVVLQKAGAANTGNYFRRTVVTRKEKKGWGVLDVGGAAEFKNLPIPTTRPGRRR